MEISEIKEFAAKAAADCGCFLVDAALTDDNDVTLTIEKEQGTVDIDDCIRLNDAFLGRFDRDVEDYSLTVTSAGLDRPFKVYGQYVKAIGTKVELGLKGGKKIAGTLVGADPCGDGVAVVVKYVCKEAVEGRKKKIEVEHEDSFAPDGVNYVKPFLD